MPCLADFHPTRCGSPGCHYHKNLQIIPPLSGAKQRVLQVDISAGAETLFPYGVHAFPVSSMNEEFRYLVDLQCPSWSFHSLHGVSAPSSYGMHQAAIFINIRPDQKPAFLICLCSRHKLIWGPLIQLGPLLDDFRDLTEALFADKNPPFPASMSEKGRELTADHPGDVFGIFLIQHPPSHTGRRGPWVILRSRVHELSSWGPKVGRCFGCCFGCRYVLQRVLCRPSRSCSVAGWRRWREASPAGRARRRRPQMDRRRRLYVVARTRKVVRRCTRRAPICWLGMRSFTSPRRRSRVFCQVTSLLQFLKELKELSAGSIPTGAVLVRVEGDCQNLKRVSVERCFGRVQGLLKKPRNSGFPRILRLSGPGLKPKEKRVAGEARVASVP